MTNEPAPTFTIDDCSDVPIELRRAFMQCAKHYGISYYYLCDVFRTGSKVGHAWSPIAPNLTAICSKCGGTEVVRCNHSEHPGIGTCPTCGPTYIDDKEPPFNTDQAISDLRAAGWTPDGYGTRWTDLHGVHWRGPAGAWRALQNQLRDAKKAAK